MAPSADAQNVPICRAVLYNPRLWQQLAQLGFADEGLVLRLLAEGNQAFDWSGLRRETRLAAACSMRSLFWAVLGTSQHTVEAASTSSPTCATGGRRPAAPAGRRPRRRLFSPPILSPSPPNPSTAECGLVYPAAAACSACI